MTSVLAVTLLVKHPRELKTYTHANPTQSLTLFLITRGGKLQWNIVFENKVQIQATISENSEDV